MEVLEVPFGNGKLVFVGRVLAEEEVDSISESGVAVRTRVHIWATKRREYITRVECGVDGDSSTFSHRSEHPLEIARFLLDKAGPSAARVSLEKAARKDLAFRVTGNFT